MPMTGSVSDNIARSRSVIHIRSAAGGPAGFFVENLAEARPMLVVVRDRPFTFSVSGSGRRGFQARLEVRGRERPGAPTQAMIVQSADNFDPNGVDSQGSVLLDHWLDSNRALCASTREGVNLDGSDIDPDDRHVITLKIIPLIKVDAAGLRWTDLGPFCSRSDYEELAALMAAYAPGKLLQNVPKDGIAKLLKSLRELKGTEGIFDVDTQFVSEGLAGRIPEGQVGDTDALFEVPVDFSKPLAAKPAAAPAPAPVPEPVKPAELQAVLKETKGSKGYLVHGAQIAAAAAVPIVSAEAGGEVTVDITLIVVDSAEALELARNKIKPA